MIADERGQAGPRLLVHDGLDVRGQEGVEPILAVLQIALGGHSVDSVSLQGYPYMNNIAIVVAASSSVVSVNAAEGMDATAIAAAAVTVASAITTAS